MSVRYSQGVTPADATDAEVAAAITTEAATYSVLEARKYGVGTAGALTDYATPLQNFLNALRDAGPGAKGVLPAGTFLIGTPLLFDTAVRLEGASSKASVLKLGDNTNGGAAVLKSRSFDALAGGSSTAGETRFAISDLRIDGNRANNASGGPGIAAFGYAFDLRDLDVRNCKGRGIHTEWGSSSALGAETSIEAFLSSLRLTDNDGGNLYVDGPHDTIMRGVVAAISSFSFVSVNPNIYIGTKAGGWQMNDCHAWGPASFGLDLRSGGIVSNTQVEGGTTALVALRAGVRWNGGKLFSNTAWTTDGKIGFQFFSGATGIVIAGAYMEYLANGFFDFTNASAANSKINGLLFHNGAGTGTHVGLVGSPASTIQWDILSNLSGGATFVLPATAKRVRFGFTNAQGTGKNVTTTAGNATLSANDVGSIRDFTFAGAMNCTVPADNGTINVGDEIEAAAIGGAVTLVPAGGVTIDKRAAATLVVPIGGKVTLRKRSTNGWLATGDLV